jgi:5-formyltetrahydrofolate cyclo-ligase
MTPRDELRREMRRLRRNVTALERRRAARRFAVIADRAYLLRPRARIAAYHAYGHEADVSHLIQRAWARGCEVFLPVITHARASRMEFFLFTPDTSLRTNAFGIPEPDPARARRITARHLDVVFMPLVAFDDRGWRLGSGAGFYDRCMHHLDAARRWRRPKLIGVAYARQRVERLSPSTWDIPMDAVITEHSFKRFQPHPAGTTP